jgi:hypothetical protein
MSCVRYKMCEISWSCFISSIVGSRALPEPVAQSVGGSDCGLEGIGFDPHSGKSKVRLFSLSILTDKDCSGGSDLYSSYSPHFLGWLSTFAESLMVGADVVHPNCFSEPCFL